MDDELLEQIAATGHARAQGVAARADRPSQRRCARDAGSRPWVAASSTQVELRDDAGDGGQLHFNGYATVYEQAYEMYDFWGPYMEVVSAGAGATSLARADLDVPLVLQHAPLRRIARTTNGTLALAEDDHGLSVDAPQLDPRDADVAYIAPKLRAGLIDEMSFMFRITRGVWSPDYTEYRIQEYDIHRGDVAIVAYGANPFTTGSGLRAADLLELARTAPDEQQRALLAELQARYAPTPQPRSGVVLTDDDERLLAFV